MDDKDDTWSNIESNHITSSMCFDDDLDNHENVIYCSPSLDEPRRTC